MSENWFAEDWSLVFRDMATKYGTVISHRQEFQWMSETNFISKKEISVQ